MSFAGTLGAEIMDRDDVTKRIMEEEDYIRCPKFGNSLVRLMAATLKMPNVDCVEDALIAKVLMMTEEEVQKIYDDAVSMIKEGMVDD